ARVAAAATATEPISCRANSVHRALRLDSALSPKGQPRVDLPAVAGTVASSAARPYRGLVGILGRAIGLHAGHRSSLALGGAEFVRVTPAFAISKAQLHAPPAGELSVIGLHAIRGARVFHKPDGIQLEVRSDKVGKLGDT